MIEQLLNPFKIPEVILEAFKGYCTSAYALNNIYFGTTGAPLLSQNSSQAGQPGGKATLVALLDFTSDSTEAERSKILEDIMKISSQIYNGVLDVIPGSKASIEVAEKLGLLSIRNHLLR